MLGAGTRSRIQARLTGMNNNYARTSKLVSDFLYLERSLIHTLAQLACSRAGTWAAWADVVCRRGVSCINKIYIFEILMKNCSKYPSPSQIG